MCSFPLLLGCSYGLHCVPAKDKLNSQHLVPVDMNLFGKGGGLSRYSQVKMSSHWVRVSPNPNRWVLL